MDRLTMDSRRAPGQACGHGGRAADIFRSDPGSRTESACGGTAAKARAERSPAGAVDARIGEL